MKLFFMSLGMLLAPVVVAAQSLNGTGSTLDSVLRKFLELINLLVPIMVAVAVVWFFWGLAKYILSDAGANKEAGRDIMIWGIIAIFVMVSVWGLVAVVGTTFGIGQGGNAPIPAEIKR